MPSPLKSPDPGLLVFQFQLPAAESHFLTGPLAPVPVLVRVHRLVWLRPSEVCGSVQRTVVLELLGVQRRAAESRPSKVMSKAFNAAFHRWVQRLRPWPVGSRLMMAM